jgi:hypothetical protein
MTIIGIFIFFSISSVLTRLTNNGSKDVFPAFLKPALQEEVSADIAYRQVPLNSSQIRNYRI